VPAGTGQLGVVAAGHPLSAQAGADALRAGGNAVDAAIGALLASLCCEPLLTGLGAGGYMLIAGGAVGEPVLLDFFVESPGRGVDPSDRAPLSPVTVSFGDALQVFNIGPSAAATYGVPAGIDAASRLYGRLPLRELTAPAARLARTGVVLTEQQAYLVQILGDLVTSTPESAALFAPGGSLLGVGETIVQPELADALELLGEHGCEPFYRGEIAEIVSAWLTERGGSISAADLAGYQTIDREPQRACFRGRQILTNPPPSAGGILIAHALALLDAQPAPARAPQIVAAMERTQAARTSEFLDGLGDPDFLAAYLSERLGSTTHVSVLDSDGMACSVTSSNGSSSGVVIPGTGVHLNNMLGEQDLNPLGFHRYPPGRRLPSMMAPTVVVRDGIPQLVLGSAGSNRIRSAILQTIVRVIDDGMHARNAVDAPRLHFEDGTVFTEPGIELEGIDLERLAHAPFRAPNLFFGGVQAVERDADGMLWGGGDSRRGGAAIVVPA
jgi:gamma-glutamyltranspeptidase/glutathione hydrolase